MEVSGLNVSRETSDKLQAFCDLVRKWTAKINLISKHTEQDIWERHVVDSAQLFDLVPSEGHWVDLGSGGGFPGIVVAILSQGRGSGQKFTLVESDIRKTVFLKTAIREFELNATVLTERIEDVEPLDADVLSARALADLGILLGYAERHLGSKGTALFLKGEKWQKEHAAAGSGWSYALEPITSKTDPKAAILRIKDIARV